MRLILYNVFFQLFVVHPHLVKGKIMSEDSTRDAAPDVDNAYESTSVPADAANTVAPKRGALRLIVLLSLLGLMLLALAYDYRVARPRVKSAYDRIASLNDAMNASPESIPTLNTHIHKEIGRTPNRTFTEGRYRVEVFSWTAGLPFRTHDLFAVYFPNGNNMVFMRHYMFQMPPPDELTPRETRPAAEGDFDTVELPGPPGMGAGPPFGGGDPEGGPGADRGPGRRGESNGRPRRPSGDADPETKTNEPSEGPGAPSDAAPGPPADDGNADGDQGTTDATPEETSDSEGSTSDAS